MRSLRSPEATAAWVLLLLACAPPRDRLLPVPVPLSFSVGGILSAVATPLPVRDPDCDPAAFLNAPVRDGQALLDTGTPLSAFVAASGPTRHYTDGQLGLRGRSGGFVLCDIPLLSVGQGRRWTLEWGGASSPVDLLIGGDILRSYAMTLTFGPDPADPLCQEPPCVRLQPTGDIANACRLAARGEVVLPFSITGGNPLSVQIGDNVFAYPATRLALPACLEPLPQAEQVSCSSPNYQENGINVRLLLSTALPGLLLSRSAFARLRGEAAATMLFAGPEQPVPLTFPGLATAPARRVSLGGAGARLALALVSKERFLSPCAELARSRRQRQGLPRCDRPDVPQDPACLLDLQNNSPQRERYCGYSGQNTQLACDDHAAPVAGVLELDGPQEALVVDDSAEILQAINADVRNGSPQVNGILGLSMLSLLQLEIDFPQSRVVAHCRCQGKAGCRAYPRFTYHDADDCADANLPLCIPARLPAACH